MKRSIVVILPAMFALVLVAALSGCTSSSGSTQTASATPAASSATPMASATPVVTLSPEQQSAQVLAVTGNLGSPMNLTVADLQKYPQISISINYSAHHVADHMSASGASLNALLDSFNISSNATMVTFVGTDSYSASIPISDIRADNQSILAIDSPPDGSLRVIVPSQYYGTDWVYDLSGIQVQ